MLWVEDQEIEAFKAILDADLRRVEELHYSSESVAYQQIVFFLL